MKKKKKAEGRYGQEYCQQHTFSQGELPDSVGVSISNVHGPVSGRSNIVRHVKVLPREEAHTRGGEPLLEFFGKRWENKAKHT